MSPRFNFNGHRRFCVLVVLFCTLLADTSGQVTRLQADSTGAPVVLGQDTMFFLHGAIGPFTAGERASAAAVRIEGIALDQNFDSDRLQSDRRGNFYDILYGQDTVLFTLSPQDASLAGETPEQLAQDYVSILASSMSNYVQTRSIEYYLKIFGSILLVIIVLWGFIWAVNRGFRRINARIIRSKVFNQDRLHLQRFELLTIARQKAIVYALLRAIKWIIILMLVYLALPVLFSILPLAEGLATRLIGYVTYPLKQGFFAIVAYIPKFIVIILIVLIVRWVTRVLRSVAREIAAGKVEISGFYPDWAIPTYNLFKFVIFIFTFVLIFPLLPGSGSAVFQGVSVFLGLLISLGSQSAISNIISGLVITYMRAFNIGDRVRIGETSGDVIDRTLLVTKVRTIKNEDVTIPNSNILSSHTVNYSTAQAEQGLVLHTTVTIGYDVPWRKVKQLLIDAASMTERIEESPEPFVLQTSLDDFYVSYQLNAYTKHAASAAAIYSELHGNIQDVFAKADVEIMSPHYRANRDDHGTTIPEIDN